MNAQRKAWRLLNELPNADVRPNRTSVAGTRHGIVLATARLLENHCLTGPGWTTRNLLDLLDNKRKQLGLTTSLGSYNNIVGYLTWLLRATP